MTLINGKPVYGNDNGWFMFFDNTQWVITDTAYNKTGKWLGNGSTSPGAAFDDVTNGSGFSGSATATSDPILSAAISGFTAPMLDANGVYQIEDGSTVNGKETFTNGNGWYMFWDGAEWVITDSDYDKTGNWITTSEPSIRGTFDSPGTGFSGQTGSSFDPTLDTDNDGILDYLDAAASSRQVNFVWLNPSTDESWLNKDDGWDGALPNSFVMDDKNNTNGSKIFGWTNHGAAYTGFSSTIGVTLGNVNTTQKYNDGASNDYTWTDIFYEINSKSIAFWYGSTPEPVSGYLASEFVNEPWKFFTANGTGNLGHTNATHVNLCLQFTGSTTKVPIPIENIHRTNNYFSDYFMLYVRFSTDADGNITF